VGGYQVKGVNQTLAETWNGVKWSIVSPPDDASGQNTLQGVSCTGADNCVAVGYYQGPDDYLTLIETALSNARVRIGDKTPRATGWWTSMTHGSGTCLSFP
jgi:hypothetical protein